MLGRLRWPLAVVFFALSFFGKAPIDAVDWLFTARGRLALLVVGLVVGFWPQLAAWFREQYANRFLAVRPISNRRLAKEARELATDMFAACRARGGDVFGLFEHAERTSAMREAATEDERNRIFHEYAARNSQKMFDEKAELAQKFGGRLHFVLDGFERRGMLNPQQDLELRRDLIEWHAQSYGWLDSAAKTIDGLARQLEPRRRWRR